MGNVNKMKEKWANKEAKVWFMEAQKWTQHLPQEEVLACPHAQKCPCPVSLIFCYFCCLQ
jgi:hypothetical protein